MDDTYLALDGTSALSTPVFGRGVGIVHMGESGVLMEPLVRFAVPIAIPVDISQHAWACGEGEFHCVVRFPQTYIAQGRAGIGEVNEQGKGRSSLSPNLAVSQKVHVKTTFKHSPSVPQPTERPIPPCLAEVDTKNLG